MVSVTNTMTGPTTLGNDVTADDLARRHAGRDRFHEFLAADRQRLAAHDAGHGQPFHRADGGEDKDEAVEGGL